MQYGDSHTTGISCGRRWSALPQDGAPIEWTIERDKGFVQGPLDLGFLRGQKLAVTLQPEQQALLVRDDDLIAVFLDGTHYLDIGKGANQIDPGCHLVFLALDEPLHLRWTRALPLQWGEEPHQSVIGNCALRVAWPRRFFDTFLAAQAPAGSVFDTGLIDQALENLLVDYLSGVLAGEGPPAESELQARVTRLSPEIVNDELSACGLQCTHLAIYTSTPPVDDEMIWRAAGNPVALD